MIIDGIVRFSFDVGSVPTEAQAAQLCALPGYESISDGTIIVFCVEMEEFVEMLINQRRLDVALALVAS